MQLKSLKLKVNKKSNHNQTMTFIPKLYISPLSYKSNRAPLGAQKKVNKMKKT